MRIRKLKDRKHNSQQKERKQLKTNVPKNNTQKTKDRAKRTSRISYCELMCFKYFFIDRSGYNTLLVF